MRYECMLPHRIREAIAENWPVALAAGVLEYHAEHLPVGVDTLLVERALLALDAETKMVLLPTLYYGPATYCVAKPEQNGSLHIDSAVLHPFARDIFRSLLRVGFRNIHVFIHHQSENFTAGMPTDLAYKLAARQITFDFLEAQRGEGWWGDNSMADYYAAHETGSDPFNWIKIHPFMDEATQKQFPIDHAGKQETSLMMAFCPELVEMPRLDASHWYCASATQANNEYAQAARVKIMAGLRAAMGLA